MKKIVLYVNDKGEVKIDYTKMLNDSFTIAHEMTQQSSAA